MRISLAAALTAFALAGCSDLGSDPPVLPRARLSAVVPDSARVGDTVRVIGSGFGAARGESTVRFGSVDGALYPAWSDTLAAVVVPDGAASGGVAVVVDGVPSGSVSFRLLGPGVVTRSFTNDVLPIFDAYGCGGCHGGSGGLFVGTPAQLLQGGTHGPAVIPGDAESSLLIRKLAAAPPFGDRMPAGGPYLPEPVVQVIKDWINQGALEN